MQLLMRVYKQASYNQLQFKYLRHCTIFWPKWPVHDLVLLIPPPTPYQSCQQYETMHKTWRNNFEWKGEGVQYYILQTCDQQCFKAKKVVFSSVSQHFCNCLQLRYTHMIKSYMGILCLLHCFDEDPVQCEVMISYSILNVTLSSGFNAR